MGYPAGLSEAEAAHQAWFSCFELIFIGVPPAFWLLSELVPARLSSGCSNISVFDFCPSLKARRATLHISTWTQSNGFMLANAIRQVIERSYHPVCM